MDKITEIILSIPFSYYVYFAMAVVYILIVYLLAIRRGGQKFLSWLLLIAVQMASVIFFGNVHDAFAGLPLPKALLAEPLLTVVTAAALFIVNLLLIFLVNLAEESRKTAAKKSD